MTRGQEQRTARQAGFSLIELVLALMVSSVGLLAVAGASMGIGIQASLARWDADQALAARTVLERATSGSYAAVVSGQRAVSLGGPPITATSTVTSLAPRLKHVRLDVTRPGHRTAAVFETRLAASRPLPVAP